jgi:1,2-diacylglycerol 3-alpha-glucosyltransferase
MRGPDDEQDNALAYAQKVQAGMKETSVRMKRRQIEQKMMLRGFSQELCSEALAKLDFAPEESREIDNLRHCANKAKRRYEKKYSSSKLRNMVFRYCAAQGYSTEDIYAILDEMEWKDEQ